MAAGWRWQATALGYSERIGRLLPGALAITLTGLAPVSRWQLARHTKWMFYMKWYP